MKKLVENDIKEIAQELKSIYNEELISVFIHGVGATEAYNPKIHSLDFAIVLKDNGIDKLYKAKDVIANLKKTNAQVSFFMTPEYIKQTLDVFPSEYLSMQINSKIIEGEDVLTNITFEKQWIRLQAERELRGLLLHLRREYLIHVSKPKELIQLWEASLKSFIPIFRSIIFLIDDKKCASPSDVLTEMDNTFNKSGKFLALSETPLKSDMEDAFKKYVTLLEEVVYKVDNI